MHSQQDLGVSGKRAFLKSWLEVRPPGAADLSKEDKSGKKKRSQESTCVIQETQVDPPIREDALEKEMATHPVFLPEIHGP